MTQDYNIVIGRVHLSLSMEDDRLLMTLMVKEGDRFQQPAVVLEGEELRQIHVILRAMRGALMEVNESLNGTRYMEPAYQDELPF